MTASEDHRTWWSTELPLRWGDLDLLGHVTAVTYAALYQEAMASFVIETWDDPDAMYVVSGLSIAYQREIRREDGPIRVHVAPSRVGRSGFDLSAVICGADGEVRSTSQTRFAAWDAHGRRSRPLTEDEWTSMRARLS